MTVGGRFTCLGRYGTPDSRERYARRVREYQASGPAAATGRPAPPPDIALTVAGVLAAFWTHAKRAYPYDDRHEGKRPPGEIGNLWDATRPVLKLYASTPALESGPGRCRWCRRRWSPATGAGT